MHINSAGEIYFGQLLISLFLFSNIIDKHKPSINKRKSACDNKNRKPKDKFSTNRKELVNDNIRNLDDKLSTNIKSLVEEKNINQDSNADIQCKKGYSSRCYI